MTLTAVFFAGWRRFYATLRRDDRQHLIDVLRDEYVDAVKDVAQFREHALRMTYPSFRDRLLRIAEEEKAHVDWLGDKIHGLGGTVPETKLTVNSGRNSWECLLFDAEAKQRACAPVLERIYNVAEQIDPEIAYGLRRIHEAEKRHRAEILDMLMKSDPQAALIGNGLGVSDSGNHI